MLQDGTNDPIKRKLFITQKIVPLRSNSVFWRTEGDKGILKYPDVEVERKNSNFKDWVQGVRLTEIERWN